MRNAVLICLILIFILEVTMFYQRVSSSKPLLGYNLLMRENVLTREQIDQLAHKLKEVGCQVVKVWIQKC